MSEPKKILFLLGSTVGDSVCLTGAIHVLKQNYPQATIDVLAPNPLIQELFLYNNDVNQVHLAPNDESLKELSGMYDFAIVFPVAAIKQLYPYLRILHVKAMLPVYGRGLIVASALDAISTLFPQCQDKMPEQYYVNPQPQHFQEAERILKNAGAVLDGKEILIGCHIGYSSLAKGKRGWWQFVRKKYGSRAWLPEKYADLLAQLVGTNPSVRFVLTGTEAELPIIKKIFKKHARYCFNIAGKSTSLLTLAAIMTYYRCYVGGDTGPMHLAVAMNIPLVALFSKRTLPNGKPYPPRTHQRVLVEPKAADIKTDEVFDLVMEMLSTSA